MEFHVKVWFVAFDGATVAINDQVVPRLLVFSVFLFNVTLVTLTFEFTVELPDEEPPPVGLEQLNIVNKPMINIPGRVLPAFILLPY